MNVFNVAHDDAKYPSRIQPQSQQPKACPVAISGDESSFFDQFGGDKKMALFVEDFMEGIMGDAELACHH